MLYFSAVITFLIGSALLIGAKTSIHEIQSFILFLISAVSFSGARIVDAINELKKDQNP